MVREPNQQKSHKKTKGVINDKFASNKKKIYLLKRTLQKKNWIIDQNIFITFFCYRG